MDVIDTFREQDTRDELGVATVRDTFSDLLFPGTSAIQTRARYFLIVPWQYQRLERAKTSSAEVNQKAKRDEIALIDVLAESDDNEGTIGVRARNTLKRLPSMIYWQGLGRWGIRTFPGSRDQYHRSLDRFYLREGGVRSDDGEIIGGTRRGHWDPGLPKAPQGLPKGCSLALTRQEAEYLRERIMHAAPRSLLAHLTDRSDAPSQVNFPWEHPDVGDFPADVRPVLLHAQNCSELMHGASLLYNLILAELCRAAENVDLYKSMLGDWRENTDGARRRYQAWDLNDFWATVEGKALSGGGRIPRGTKRFVNAWLKLLREANSANVVTSEPARTLVKEREREIKRGLARVDGGRALELFGGAAGANQMDFRWKATVMRVIADIHEGLHLADA